MAIRVSLRLGILEVHSGHCGPDRTSSSHVQDRGKGAAQVHDRRYGLGDSRTHHDQVDSMSCWILEGRGRVNSLLFEYPDTSFVRVQVQLFVHISNVPMFY